MPLNHTSRFSEPTEQQYASLGRAVVEWANVEHLLGALLSRLLSTPDFLARTYTASMSAMRMQEAIKEGVEIHIHRYGYRLISKERVEEIIKINTDVTSLRTKRNKIAHFCWSRQNDEVMFGTTFPGGVRSEKNDARGYATLTNAELSNLNAEANALVERLLTILPDLPEITEESILPPRSGKDLD
jgi:hypothetical protein